MINDPIVEEIHRIRAKLLDECHGDLEKLLDCYKSFEELDKDRVVTLADVREKAARRAGKAPALPGGWGVRTP